MHLLDSKYQEAKQQESLHNLAGLDVNEYSQFWNLNFYDFNIWSIQYMMNVPEAIRLAVTDRLTEQFKKKVDLIEFSFTPGGCINRGGKLSTTAGNYFLKWNVASKYPDMFVAERAGLDLLGSTKTVQVPRVVLNAEVDSWQFILMEFIDGGHRSKKFWQILGEQLAALHHKSNDYFGLEYDNYIGSLAQPNTRSAEWIDFFIHHRLEVMVKRLHVLNQVDHRFIKSINRLYDRLGDLIPCEPPAMLHGDLWAGNVITGSNGEPVTIDPAVYFGHREAEIAFTRLFGGFDNDFYSAYNANYPLISGFEQRYELYNLYPLLVHANLFGNSYLLAANRIINHFTR